MFNLLTELDKKRIINYITYNISKPQIPLEELLLPWAEAKSEYLSELFGENLIIKTPITFNEGWDEFCDKYKDKILDDERCYNFICSIRNLYRSYCEDYDWNDPKHDIYYFVNSLFTERTLKDNAIKNYVEENGYYNLPIKNTVLRVQEGMKPMKIITKIAQAYQVGITPDENGITDLEYFRRAHSLCLNEKTLSGNLCLSIHPLDYMTMSDNSCGWSSCMSWLNDGEYKLGTVEMMNSPCVIVGYLESSSPFKWEYSDEEVEWNSKKWRCLFIVDKEFIINVKGYPYENDNLVKAAIEKISELAGWGKITPVKYDYYNWEKHRRDKIPVNINGRDIAIEFHTCAMYNDFATCNHYIVVNPNHHEPYINHSYFYSGVAECMLCGNTDDGEIGRDYGEENLTCTICNPRFYCADCGEYEFDNCHTTADGYNLCEWCWDNSTYVDSLDNNIYYADRTIILLKNKKDKIIYTPIPVNSNNYDTENWYKYFKISEPREDKGFNQYLYVSDCKAEGLELFEVPSDEIETLIAEEIT